LKAKIKLNKDFYLILIFLIFFILLYIQYNYSKKNIIKTYKNQKLTEAFLIKSSFKNIFNNAELLFKSKLDENIKEINTLFLLYNNIKSFNPEKIAKILNKNKTKGHYEVFVIDKNYRIIKTSYKPDLGYNLGQFPVFKKILDSVFEGKEHINVSPIYIDPASMNLKRYFLILSPDKKYLLQIAYVVDIYPVLKKTYFCDMKKYDDLKNLKLYFVSKYLIYPIHFRKRLLIKTPLNVLMAQTRDVFKEILKTSDINIKESKNFFNNENTAKRIFSIFQQKNIISKLDLKNNTYEIFTIINGFFKNFTNKLIIKNVFNTNILENNLLALKNRYLFLLIFFVSIVMAIRVVIYYISKKLNDLVEHMQSNEEITQKDSIIKEIDDLIGTYNYFRQKLNEEAEKNKKLLMQNRQFIIDTVHQIKTPLSIITLNSDFIKMKLDTNDKEIKEALDEIDAAISILTTSYEDLSYLSSENIVEYKPSNINLSEVVSQRVKFFINLANAKHKKLIVNIAQNILYNINKVEIERIADNNISNAIEYSTGEKIVIELKKEDGIIILRFVSRGERIKNPNKIFEKNYREHIHKRGLGVGLNIVKKICEKYGIEYKVYYKNGNNIFEYRFKT